MAEHINAAAGSTLWPFATGVVGGVWLGRVRLRFSSSFTEYNAKPVLAGRLRKAPAGSILNLRYRAPLWVYAFDVIWYAFWILFGLMLAFGDLNPELTSTDFVIFYLAWAAMVLIPLGLHYFGTRNSGAELTYLLDFLAEHADARPQIL